MVTLSQQEITNTPGNRQGVRDASAHTERVRSPTDGAHTSTHPSAKQPPPKVPNSHLCVTTHNSSFEEPGRGISTGDMSTDSC